MNNNAKAAADFVGAIREIAGKPENLENLQSYLTYHFDKWLEMWAGTPEGMAAEMQAFARMEL